MTRHYRLFLNTK